MGKYISYEKYLNTMFYLEYEDCYRNLRNSIYELQFNGQSINNMEQNKLTSIINKYKDLYFYLYGEIINININQYGVIISLQFCAPNFKKIKFIKKMMKFSLVILTNNNFEKYLLTTVFNNPYSEDDIIHKAKFVNVLRINNIYYYQVDLSLLNIETETIKFLFNNRKNLQIFESKAYFESYIHVLNRIKEIN